MGRYKVIMTDREGKYKKEYVITFSTKEEFGKEMRRVLDSWIKETNVLNFWEASVRSA